MLDFPECSFLFPHFGPLPMGKQKKQHKLSASGPHAFSKGMMYTSTKYWIRNDTVGRNPANQLRSVVSPIICRGFSLKEQVVQEF